MEILALLGNQLAPQVVLVVHGGFSLQLSEVSGVLTILSESEGTVTGAGVEELLAVPIVATSCTLHVGEHLTLGSEECFNQVINQCVCVIMVNVLQMGL